MATLHSMKGQQALQSDFIALSDARYAHADFNGCN